MDNLPHKKSLRVIDLQTFFQKTGNKPIFTRKVLETAQTAIKLVKEHAASVTLIDCFGNEVIDEIGHTTRASLKQATLEYNTHHILADQDSSTRAGISQSYPDAGDVWWSHVHFPVYAQVLQTPWKGSEWLSIESSKASAAVALDVWNKSPERAALIKRLQSMKATVPVTNIICIGHGCVRNAEDDMNECSSIQHFAAVTIAEELERVYHANKTKVVGSIQILAQDPRYTPECGKILDSLNLSHPIKIVEDPDAFLAINSGSLIFSCYPGVPVKQIIGDLVTENPSIRPAAFYWTESDARDLTGMDNAIVSSEYDEGASYTYKFANPMSRRMYELQEYYQSIIRDPRGRIRNVWGRVEDIYPSFSWWMPNHLLARRLEQ